MSVNGQAEEKKTDSSKLKYLHHYLRRKTGAPLHEYLPTLEILEEEYINYVLELTGNDLVKSADILNISPLSLFNKLKRFELCL